MLVERTECIADKLIVKFISDKEGSQLLDTDVYINEKYTITIAGGSINEFITDLKLVLLRHRI